MNTFSACVGRYLIVSFLILLTACADKTLTRENARALLQKPGLFTDGVYLGVKTGHFCSVGPNLLRQYAKNPQNARSDENHPYFMAVALESAGLSNVELQPNEIRTAWGQVTHEMPTPDGLYGCYNVSLTPKAQQYLQDGHWKDISRDSNGNVTYQVKMATIEIADITGIVSDPDHHSATVDFNFKISPTEERDFFFKPPVAVQIAPSTAVFQLYDDGWRIKRDQVSPASNP
jgi:hypothetical protein